MPISDRLKGLLNWWQLRIETARKENQDNVARINTIDASNTSVRGVNKHIQRQGLTNEGDK